MKTNPRFEGRTAIVTGGTAGIGLSIVSALCAEGCNVALTGLPGDSSDTTDILKSKGYSVISFEGDMSDEAFCEKVVSDTLSEFGTIHHLVNNAFSFNCSGLDATQEDWDRIMNVGPVAYARMIQLVAPGMKKCGSGSIVNISSISAHVAQPNRWTYNSAKGAVTQLTRCAAMDLGEFGIRVNTISPGWTWTREVEKAAGGDREKWEPVWGDYSVLRRLCDVHEVASPTLFLLSDDASFVTGSELAVDGGYGAMGPEGLGKTSNFAGTN